VCGTAFAQSSIVIFSVLANNLNNFKLFAKTEKITMEDSRKANGMLKYRL
jgi:hypothetical protein